MTDRTCTIEGCEKPHEARGWCPMHYVRWKKHGDTSVVLPGNRSSMPGEMNPNWRGDEAGTGGAHKRVRRLYGSAKEHACRHCDGPAAHWAYDHADPNERQDAQNGPYSLDPDHYMPLCVPCHKRFDLAHRSA